jgi:hypothetical protein
MVYCDAFLMGLNTAYRRTFMETAPSDGEATFEAILDMRCNVITSGTMARRQAIIDAGWFETERVRAHDFHLWLRMAKNGAKIGYQKKQLLKYRVHLDSLSGDSVSRVEREINAFERVRGSIELNRGTIRYSRTADRRSSNPTSPVEQGKAFLLQGDYHEAAVAFRVANKHRHSLKLSLVTLLARIAPGTLLKFYRSARAGDIALVPKHN